MRFFDRRIHMVTGKGGVGRTTVAVALAKAAAATGRKVLVTEFGDIEGGHSAVGQRFGREKLKPEPVQVERNLFANQIWAPTGHEGFLRSVLPGGALIGAALRSKALQKFLNAAPSFHEMGQFYHLLTLMRAQDKRGEYVYDAVIIDMPATGHALALSGLPEILLRLVPSGPIAKTMREGQSYLNDPKKTAAWVVTLPEKLPVTESIELIAGLRATKVTPGGVLVNRFMPDPFTAEERAALSVELEANAMHGGIAFHRIGAMQPEAERMRAAVDLPVITLPEVPIGDPVPQLVAKLAQEMGR